MLKTKLLPKIFAIIIYNVTRPSQCKDLAPTETETDQHHDGLSQEPALHPRVTYHVKLDMTHQNIISAGKFGVIMVSCSI